MKKNELCDILNELPNLKKTSSRKSEREIKAIEQELNLKFPAAYRSFIEKYGTLQTDYIAIYGLPINDHDELSVSSLTQLLRLSYHDFPEDILPFQDLGGERFACLNCSPDIPDNSRVIVWNSNSDQKKQEPLSEDFEQYLYRLLYDWKWWKKGLERLEWHIKNTGFQYDHQSGGQIPRSHIWRPYRFCVQDVILGITVVRHNTLYNRLEVDVFLTAEVPEYESNSGCRALSLMLLSDAYKSGGSMEIRFTSNIENSRVPRELCDYANSLNVPLSHVREGGISPKEAKMLYLAVSDLRLEIRDKIMEMDEAGTLSAVSAAYAVNRGVWTPQELETILLTSPFPESLLKGSFPPEIWHLFHYDMSIGRTALMGGYLDRQLSRHEHTFGAEQGAVLELEDDERKIDISWNQDFGAKVYKLIDPDEKAVIPWCYHEDTLQELLYGQELWVSICARECEDIEQKWNDDLQHLVELKNGKDSSGGKNLFCIMYPADFNRLNTAVTSKIFTQLKNQGIRIMICPDFIVQLDQEVVRRFEALKIMRQ